MDWLLEHPLQFTIACAVIGVGVIGYVAVFVRALPGLATGIVAGLAVAFLPLALDRPSSFPRDIAWYEGKIASIHEAWDGDFDITFDDGVRIVVSGGPDVNPGEVLHLLHAGRASGAQRTFFCHQKDRATCHALSLAIAMPFDAVTANQGRVTASVSPAPQAIKP